ncbi:alpha/beta hydrolase family protein [Kitasatospora sp. NPDC054939]
MKKIIHALAVAAATAVLAAPTALAAPASAADRPADPPAGRGQGPARIELPRPTGNFAVGRDTVHLVDRGRKDPWVPAEDRELMLSLYYPAHEGTGTPAPYLAVDEAKALLTDRGQLAEHTTPERVAATRTHARAGAVPRATAPRRYPLVVLSPGFTMPRASLTGLAEDLASRGYVVATVDHAYESDGTVFPGGRLLACQACEQVFPTRDLRRVSDGRAKDLSFVLDRLTGPRPAWRHSWLIDPRAIGVAGHSIGGNAASATMAADPRVDAGANLDGTFFTPVPEAGLNGRPFLMVAGDPALLPPDLDDPSWGEAWPRLDGWKRWLTVTGMGHPGFTDWPVLGDASGYPHPETPLSGARSQQIVRSYVGAFFDLQLRGIPAPRLDGPSAADPEVVFHRP